MVPKGGPDSLQPLGTITKTPTVSHPWLAIPNDIWNQLVCSVNLSEAEMFSKSPGFCQWPVSSIGVYLVLFLMRIPLHSQLLIRNKGLPFLGWLKICLSILWLLKCFHQAILSRGDDWRQKCYREKVLITLASKKTYTQVSDVWF